jgi:hypothetical protein
MAPASIIDDESLTAGSGNSSNVVAVAKIGINGFGRIGKWLSTHSIVMI